MPHKTDRENRVIELTDQLDRENHVTELTELQLNAVSGGIRGGWNRVRNVSDSASANV
jgi:hypothetical protein